MTSVNWFPFIVWVQSITHRASDLATNDFLHWAILSTPILTLCVVDGNNYGWFSSSVTPPHVLHYYIIISNKSWMGIVPQSKVNLTLKSERYWLENWRGRNKECKRQRKEPQDVGGIQVMPLCRDWLITTNGRTGVAINEPECFCTGPSVYKW